MLNVWCVSVGDKYPNEEIYRLNRQVRENLSQPHQFFCLSDRFRPSVTCVVPTNTWPGWWSKLLLFDVSSGTNLYLDLDVVVVGPLDDLVSDGPLTMPANWAKSGHGGWQSSVMSWGQDYSDLARKFDPEKLTAPERGNHGWYEGLWGDQEYITRELNNAVRPMRGVYSYRYHCAETPPEDAAVVAFHGSPKPNEVNVPWVKAARFT